MTQATVTKILSKIANDDAQCSLGFRRLSNLPSKMAVALQFAMYLAHRDDNEHARAKAFLEAMSEEEFVIWMKANYKKVK